MSQAGPPDDDAASGTEGPASGTEGPASGTDEPPASGPDPSSGPDTAAAPRRDRTRRLVLLLALAAAVAGLVVFLALRQRGAASDGVVPGDGGTPGPLVQAPRPPQLGGDPGDGVRLSGFVVDGTNAPVVGVEVSAELEQGAVDRALATTPVTPAGSSGSGMSRDAGAPAAGDAGAPASGVIVAPVTGSDGRFVLAGLVAGRYRLRVTGPGILAAEVRFVPVPSDEIRVVVARQVTIAGTVVDGGQPVAGANVGVRGEAIGGAIEIKTDSKGAFELRELPEGRYQVYAWRDTLAARAVRVNRLGAGPFPPIELSLEAAAIVVGRVIDRDEGTGLPAAIELRPSGDDQAPRYARSNPDGTFRIEGVPNGRWIADAYAIGYTSPGGVELEAGKGIPELALTRGATIEGRVLDAGGRPIANAAVRAIGGTRAGDRDGTGIVEHSAAVDQDRLRRFSGRIAAPTPVATLGTSADPMLLPRGELGVMVGPIPPIPPPGAQLARPATIDRAIASAFVGEPPPLAVDPAAASIWITGPDGRFRIRGLPRGKVAVLALAPGYAEGSSRQVGVELGQVITNVDVVLSAGTMLVGRVTDQHGVRVAGAQVQARPALGSPLDAFTDEDGTYRLGPVTGAVELTASAYGHADATRTIELEPGTTPQPGRPDERREDFTLVVADAVLAGTLDDETGAPVAGAHLEVIRGTAGGRQAVVAADGTFSIDMLPAGPVRVRVTHPAYPITELDAVAAGPERGKVRLRLPLGGAIEGALLDGASGTPLANVVLAGEGPGGATAEATSGSDGRWKLGPLRPGRWKLAIEQPGYLPAAREVEVPAARVPGATSVHDVRFDLARGALVGGTVRDARGQRLPGAMILVQAASGDGPTVTGTCDAQGEFRVRDVPTGDVVVSAVKGDVRGGVRVTLRPGDEVLGLAIETR